MQNVDRPFVYVTRAIPTAARARLEALARVAVWSGDGVIPRSRLLEEARGAVALLVTLSDPIDGAVMDVLTPRVIANFAVGVNNVDVAAATARGIVVTHTPGVLTDDTADLAMGLILDGMRRISEGDRLVRRGEFPGWTPTFHLGRGLRDKQLGVVGFGRIGRAVAARAQAFGMRVVHHTRAPTEDAEGHRSLAQLLDTSDVVSLHVPLTPDTHHLIDAAALARMKPDALLVNTSRGGVVDQEALLDGLRARIIGGASLDVYQDEEEGIDPRFFALENVVLAPHIGSATQETRDAMGNLAAQSIVDVLAGRRPQHVVNPEVFEGERSG